MSKWNKLFALVGVVALTFVIVSVNAPQSHGAQGGPAVTVVNTPLPVAITGSTTISGTVAATQSGAWNVGITGSSTTNPLLVRDVDNATRQPVAFALTNAKGTFTVPDNKRLVIEYVSWRGTVNQGNIVAVGLRMTTNGFEGTHYIPGSPVTDENIGGMKVWLVGDPGSDVVYQSALSIGDGIINVSGYYVDAP